MKKNTIALNKDEYSFIETGEKIKVGQEEISINLLRTLIKDDYFDEFKCILKNEVPALIIKQKEIDNKKKKYKISSLSRAYENILIDSDTTDKDFDRILSIRDLTSFDRFIDRYKERVFYLRIDNVEYKIKANKIIRFLLLDNEYYKLFMNSNFYDEIPIDDFLYSVKRLFIDMSLDNKYVFPQHVKYKINDITKNKRVDIQAKNSYLETKDKWMDQAFINNDFEKEILTIIPKSLSDIEKAIILYVILCQKLTYDHLSMSQQEKQTEYHSNIQNLINISSHNNKIVCYEFNTLYGYFLNKLGINHISICNELFYATHSTLEYRVGKFIISADSVTSILNGDLVRSKIGYELNGLKCINKNIETRKEFDSILKNTYDFIKKEKIDIDFLKDENITQEEKLKTIISIINLKELSISDKLGYIYILKENILGDSDITDNHYIIVNSIEDSDNPLRCIFSLKTSDDYKYYYYNPKEKEVKELSKENLNLLFNSGVLKYLPDSYLRIPGIIINKEQDESEHIKQLRYIKK